MGETGVPVSITVPVEKVLLADLERERCLLDDEDVSRTLIRRIEAGVELVGAGGLDQIELRPVPRNTQPLTLELNDVLAELLEEVVEIAGFDADVVVAGFARSASCKPEEVRDAELGWSQDASREGRILRAEPGRGKIYRASFELPGYQLAFLTLLGRGRLSQSDVIEEALLALARQACETRIVRTVPLSEEAHSFADRMLAMAKRPAPRSFRPRRT